MTQVTIDTEDLALLVKVARRTLDEYRIAKPGSPVWHAIRYLLGGSPLARQAVGDALAMTDALDTLES